MDAQILVPDLTATGEVDLIALQFRHTIKNGERFLETLEEDAKESQEELSEEDAKRREKVLLDAKKETQDQIDAAKAALEKHSPNGTTPTLVVGYIPPRKLSTLRNELSMQMVRRHDLQVALEEARKEGKDLDAAEERHLQGMTKLLDQQVELHRKTVRWGIRGHRNLGSVEFQSEDVMLGPQRFTVATWVMVEMYESISLMGIDTLKAISDEVMEFNTLSNEKKNQLLSQHGTSQETLTAPSVTENQA